MRCERCGSYVRGGLRFCTECGAPVREPRPDLGASADVPETGVPETGVIPLVLGAPPRDSGGGAPAGGGPDSRRPPTWGKIVALVCAAAVVVLIAAVGITLSLSGGRTRVVVYGSTDAVSVSREAAVIPKGSDGQPLEHYFVRITAGLGEDGADVDVAGAPTLEVTGTGGFTFGDLLDGYPDGTYDTVITDDEGREKECPPFAVDEEGDSEPVDILPDQGGDEADEPSVSRRDVLFLDKLEELVAAYGEPKVSSYLSSGNTFAKGLSLALLVDFGDGVERLVVSYCDGSRDWEHEDMPEFFDYALEVWEYDKTSDALRQAWEGEVLYTNGGFPYVTICRFDGSGLTAVLQLERGSDAEGRETVDPQLFGPLEDGSFGQLDLEFSDASDAPYDREESYYFWGSGWNSEDQYGSEEPSVYEADSGVEASTYEPAGSIRVTLDTIEELRARVGDEPAEDPEDATAPATVSWREVTQDVAITSYVDGIQGRGTMEATWGYLELSAEGESEAVSALNERFKADFDRELALSESWSIDELEADGECTVYRSSVTYERDGIIGMRVSRYRTFWGPHGWDELEGAVFDLETGEELGVWEVAGMSEAELDAHAVDVITEYVKGREDSLVLPMSEWEIRSEAADLVSSVEQAGYLLAEEGITIFLPSYSMGFPYSDGSKEILVVSFDDSVPEGTDLRGSYAIA